jgi:serine/threonine protein kinase/formylglycine-generating enzyme required for sulfatase activity
MPLDLEGHQQPVLTPGQKFGQFVVIEEIGSGGMGQVYKVRHTTFEADFALKILHSDIITDPAAMMRLRNEARTGYRLKHPNVVGIDEFNEIDGRFYIRMPLMRGFKIGAESVVSLRQVIKQNGGRLQEGDAAIILHDILLGLAYAHKERVVHRDLKPANILFNGEIALISDFGLVRIVGEDFFRSRLETIALSKMPSSSASSGSAALIGTYNFMAPEQRMGREADQRSDVYAIGLIALNMITGSPNFGMKAPSKTLKGLSREWDDFLAKALEQDPADRFQNGGEMLEAMPCLGAPVFLLQERANDVVPRKAFVSKKKNKRPIVAVLAAVVFGAVVAGAFLTLSRCHKGVSDVVVDKNASGAADKASGVGLEVSRSSDGGSSPAGPVAGVTPQQSGNSLPDGSGTKSSPDGHTVSKPAEVSAQLPALSADQANNAAALTIPATVGAASENSGANGALLSQKNNGQTAGDTSPPVATGNAGEDIDLPPLETSGNPAQSSRGDVPVTADANGLSAHNPASQADMQAGAPKAQQVSAMEESAAQPAADRTWLTLPLSGVGETMKLRRIEAGRFMYGSKSDEVGRAPTREVVQHEVVVSKAFYIGQFEVTQRQYEAVVGKNPSHFRADDNPVEQVSYQAITRRGGFLDLLNNYLATSGHENLRARLPTEEEWEYACRAGTSSAFYDGTDLPDASQSAAAEDFAVCGKLYYGKITTQKVGSLTPNKWELFDMSGNVEEITDKGVLRGGSWASPARDCRSAARRPMGVNFRGDDRTGFRMVIEDLNERPAN